MELILIGESGVGEWESDGENRKSRLCTCSMLDKQQSDKIKSFRQTILCFLLQNIVNILQNKSVIDEL